MGIKHLWTILTPFCERKPLFELQGKRVAIDLSCWICEAQNIAEYQVQPRMYLRNLYFRTCYLLLLDVSLIFVLEGKAPELKYDTIAVRNAIQFKGAKPKTDGVKTGKDRSRFNFVLKRCEEMLGLMGISCIEGKGEAESLCAYLNEEELVDGCISQDSDCFAYGAKVVYRNFSVASQGANKSSGGAVDIYNIAKANENLDFGRNKIIAMALLCGSDYGDGVQGVGKESVLKFFEDVQDKDVLNRLRSWRKTPEVYEKYEKLFSDKNICTSCGHHGKVNAHNKNGCESCGMMKGCSNEKYKTERLKLKNELQIRNKALQDPTFPNEDLIMEFLTRRDQVSTLDLEWKKPNLIEFVRFTTKYLQWEELYGFEKVLPILTRWQCINYGSIKPEKSSEIVYPDHIKKVRNPKGVPSYEIVWSDPQGYFKDVVPKEQIENVNTTEEALWSTIEPQQLVDKAYPELVEIFKKSKIKSRRRKNNVAVDDIEKMLLNTSISEPKIKKKRKTIKKKNEIVESSDPIKKPTLLEMFLKNQGNKASTSELESNNAHCHTSTPSKSSVNFIDMSIFDDDDENDTDLSNIIEKIISREPQNSINLENVEIGNHEVKNEIINFNNVEEQFDERNSSSFFITGPVENDMFEKTFNEMLNGSDESTVEYDYHELDFLKEETNINSLNKENSPKTDKIDSDDSFCDLYVPLIERLKKKT